MCEDIIDGRADNKSALNLANNAGKAAKLMMGKDQYLTNRDRTDKIDFWEK